MANYTPDYSNGDIVKAGQNTITISILELSQYITLCILAVIIGFILNAWLKKKK